MRDRAERPKRARRAPGATERSGRSEGAERPERGSEALGAPEASVPQAFYRRITSSESTALRCVAPSKRIQHTRSAALRCVAPLHECNTTAALRSAASSCFKL